MAAAPGWWPVSAPSWTCLDRSWTGSSVEFRQNLTSTDFNSASCFFSISATDFMSNSKTWQLEFRFGKKIQSHTQSHTQVIPVWDMASIARAARAARGCSICWTWFTLERFFFSCLISSRSFFSSWQPKQPKQRAPWAPKKSQVDGTGGMSILDQRCDQILKNIEHINLAPQITDTSPSSQSSLSLSHPSRGSRPSGAQTQCRAETRCWRCGCRSPARCCSRWSS